MVPVYHPDPEGIAEAIQATQRARDGWMETAPSLRLAVLALRQAARSCPDPRKAIVLMDVADAFAEDADAIALTVAACDEALRDDLTPRMRDVADEALAAPVAAPEASPARLRRVA